MISATSTLSLISLIGISVIIISIITIFSKENIIRAFAFSSLSFLICLIYLLLDAPDVALTEASIGACLTSVIIVIFISKIKESDSQGYSLPRIFLGCITIIFIFAFFIKIEEILPDFGSVNSPLNQGVSQYYIKNTIDEIGISSFVAAILASYRGFDTLGETLVILVAGIGVSLIFGVKNEK
jgi:multicomponent Na+:H+ antiporter subunit B